MFFTCVPVQQRDSFFIYLVKNMILKKRLEVNLFLFYFLREKQNKKEKP